jgi:hypothetical protein
MKSILTVSWHVNPSRGVDYRNGLKVSASLWLKYHFGFNTSLVSIPMDTFVIMLNPRMIYGNIRI